MSDREFDCLSPSAIAWVKSALAAREEAKVAETAEFSPAREKAEEPFSPVLGTSPPSGRPRKTSPYGS